MFGGVTPAPMGKVQTRAFHEAFCAAFPDARAEVLDLIQDGERVGARLVLHLTHEGEFMGVPATGARADFFITTLLTVRDGRCVERWSTADMYGLMMRLGAVPAPAARPPGPPLVCEPSAPCANMCSCGGRRN